MASHELTDKSLFLESQWGGWTLLKRDAFAEPDVGPNFAPDRGFELDHIALDLTIDPDAKTLKGVATLRVRPLPTGLHSVDLSLEDLTVVSVTNGDGVALEYRHSGGKLNVRGLGPEGGTVRVTYYGSPTRGLYFVGAEPDTPNRLAEAWTQCQDEDAHYVFPCFDHPQVKCPFSVQIRAPGGFTVVSNGALEGVQDDADGWKRWSFEQAEPMPAYLFSAVVARLDVVEEEWRGKPVRYLVPEGTDEATTRRVFEKTPRMLEFFSNLHGVEYPWPRYDQVIVHDFIFGGMENVAATTLVDISITDERSSLDWNAESLIAHELAHQWFGDFVTCRDWSQAWLNEGWATYSEYTWRTEDLGAEEATYYLFQTLSNYLDEAGGRYQRSIVSYQFRYPIDIFDRHLYEKGAMVNHTLRNTLGEDVFWSGARRYLHENAYGSVHTQDYQDAMEAVSGRNLDRFFQQWVHAPGHPVVEISLAHADGLLTVSVAQKQEGDGVPEAFVLPLRVVVVGAQGEEVVDLVVNERSRTFTLPCADEPVAVWADPGLRFLADVTLKAPRAWLLEMLKRGPCPVLRIRAARALSEEGSHQALQALVSALSSEPYWGVRADLAKILGKKAGSSARIALLGRLAEESHAKALRAVVTALQSFRHDDVYTALTALALEGHPSIHVEGEAARVLGVLRAPQAREVCEALLERESWAELLRARALQGLGATRDEAVLPVLLGWLDPERPVRARIAACSALGHLADEVPDTRLAAIDILCRLATAGRFRLRLAAVSALGRIRDVRGAGVLRQIHQTDTDGRMRRMAYEALKKINTGRSGEEALSGIRGDLEKLQAEHRALVDRLVKVEGAKVP